MGHDLLMLGGGHAQLSLIAAAPELVAEGHRLTLVSPETVHYYSGMGPGMLGGSYEPEEIRFPIRAMAEQNGIRWIRDRAVRINPVDRTVVLSAGDELPYDVLSVNTGSAIAATVATDPDPDHVGPRVLPVKPIERMLEARRFLESADPERQQRVVVVGGGPAAVEVAANVRRLVRERSSLQDQSTAIELIVGRTVLPGFPRSAERKVVNALSELGVRVRRAQHVRRVGPEGIVTVDGNEQADLVLLATGVVPSRLFRDSQMPVGTDGSMAVDEYLHCLGHREVFGGGDCIWHTPRPLPRAGVFAVRQSPVLVHNVTAALNGRFERMKRFRPGGSYLLLLNLGDGTALFWRRVLGMHVVYRGRSAWNLKDRIDRAFMNRFGSEADRGNEH